MKKIMKNLLKKYQKKKVLNENKNKIMEFEIKNKELKEILEEKKRNNKNKSRKRK